MLNAFSKPSSNEVIIRHLIKLLGVKVTNTSIKDALQNHPNYPSILSFADVLKHWNIDNAILQVEKDNLSQIPIPFIAHTNKSEFLLITEIIEKEKISYLNEKGETNVSTIADFLQIWSGVALVVEKTEQSGEKNFEKIRQQEKRNNIKTPLFFVGLVLSFVLLAIKGYFTANNYAVSNFIYFLFTGVFKIAGIIVTSLLLWYEIDKANPVLQKICTAGAKTNCNAILSGKQSKLFNWLSWSEIGFFYFLGTFLFLTLSYDKPISILLIVIFNLFTLYYPFFSIYYQWKIAKQWCILCLATQIILVAEFLIALSTHKLNSLSEISFTELLHQLLEPSFLISFLIPIFLWFFIKPFLLKAQENKRNKTALMRLKYDTRIFNALLPKQKKLEHNATGLGITVGNPNAEHTIIKVCNPYCGPCAAAHPEIEAIIENNPNVKAQIIFKATNKIEDRGSYPVKHLLAIAAKQNEIETKKSLDDWYLAPQKDYETFKLKYPMNGELEEQGDKLNKMKDWCTKVDIQFTPTIFINGYQMPDVYEIKDLKYLLS